MIKYMKKLIITSVRFICILSFIGCSFELIGCSDEEISTSPTHSETIAIENKRSGDWNSKYSVSSKGISYIVTAEQYTALLLNHKYTLVVEGKDNTKDDTRTVDSITEEVN